MNKNRNIAFVLRPHNPAAVRIDTIPFVFNSIKKIAALDWNIDVYVWEGHEVDYAQMFPPNVNILYQEDSPVFLLDTIIYRISPRHFKQNKYYLKFRYGKKYRCVFGVGQISAYIAGLIADRNDAPLIIFNDEFPSAWGNATGWEELERSACRSSNLLVVPDRGRIQPLLEDVGALNHPVAVLPNTAEVKLPPTEINWHERLNISPDKQMCLNAGAAADFAAVPELMTSVAWWPKNAVLVMNERNRRVAERARKNYAHLELPGRIYWTAGGLSEEELNSLVSYCVLNFGLYRNVSSNVEYMGFSSGKLMRSIALGIPVIASDLISLQFIKEYNLGVLVKHPQEIPIAILHILNSGINYKANCIDFYNKSSRFDNYWSDFCDMFLKTTGIRLDQ